MAANSCVKNALPYISAECYIFDSSLTGVEVVFSDGEHYNSQLNWDTHKVWA